MAEGEPAAKRVRLNDDGTPEGTTPSAVLHARNLPLDVNEYELKMLFPNKDAVVKVLILKGKGQGFAQFTDVHASAFALKHFETTKALVRGKQTYLQYSRRNELDANVPVAPTFPTSTMSVMGAGPSSVTPLVSQGASRPGSVIHVNIMDCFYPITIDLLYTVFQTCGSVLKMILLEKSQMSGSTQVLVQYADETMAENARASLQGKYLFDGAGLLRVQTSKFDQLKILYNNEKSRDYTQNLPYGPANAGPPLAPQAAMPFMQAHSAPIFGHPGVVPQQMAMQNPMAAMGGGPGQMGMPGMMGGGMEMMMGGAPGAGVGASPVVLANKLNEEKITTDALFNLFGVYGDVTRVKILYNKRHTALVQMANGAQAQQVVRMLNNTPLFGKPMSLTISSHAMVKLPNPESEEGQSKNTVSYEKSEFHRFAHPGSKNYNNIFPPSNNLHLSNLPDGITEDQIKSLFAPYGTVQSFRFFQNNNKMAVIVMGTIGEAVDALVSLHQYAISQDHRLRVSFAKQSKSGA